MDNIIDERQRRSRERLGVGTPLHKIIGRDGRLLDEISGVIQAQPGFVAHFAFIASDGQPKLYHSSQVHAWGVGRDWLWPVTNAGLHQLGKYDDHLVEQPDGLCFGSEGLVFDNVEEWWAFLVECYRGHSEEVAA